MKASEMKDEFAGKMGILCRPNPSFGDGATAVDRRLQPIFPALAQLNVAVEPVLYSEDQADEVRDTLLRLDGVLVWVDPIDHGRDRCQLDALLREVSSKGIWVSAHPDIILKMGTKEVVFETRSLGWGADTYLYSNAKEFREQFPKRLASSRQRVLKQYRGNAGIGVWKVELRDGEPSPLTSRTDGVAPGADSSVRVLQARRGSIEQDMRLGEFMSACEAYFSGSGRLIDQAFQERLPEGMIRCYLTQNEVIGFAHQIIRGLMPAPPASTDPPQPGPRTMHPASAPGFKLLRDRMESEWVPAINQLLSLSPPSLPVLWDADFLFGPKTESGEDTYVLCEINVSCVTPFPEFAAGQIAQAAVAAMLDTKKSRT
jgi:hypothetical protein